MNNDILQNEIRTLENVNDIFLYKEGDWWRAYEWSAYLLHKYAPLEESQRLKPSRRNTQDTGQEWIMVGLQLASFSKYLPGLLPEDVESQNSFIIHSPSSYTLSNYKTLLEEWRNLYQLKSLKVEKTKEERREERVKETSFCSISMILQQVLSYPIEKRTPLENMEFISSLKSQLSKII